MIIWQILEPILMGMKVGFDALVSALSLYQQFSDLKEQIIALFFNVPVAIITIVSLVISAAGILIRLTKKPRF